MLSTRRTQRGLSLVELMVGVTVGMVVVAASALLSGRSIANTRALLGDIRVNQDLRAVTDLVTRELRRASYWGNAIQGTLASGSGTATTVNPYATISVSGSNNIFYGFTRDATEDNVMSTNEMFGFRLNSGKVEMQTVAEVWQPVTDPDVVTITAFTITPTETALPVGHLCPTTCAPGAPNCPTITVRRYDVLIRGQSVRDAAVVRELRTSVRVRNDIYSGICPA